MKVIKYNNALKDFANKYRLRVTEENVALILNKYIETTSKKII